MLAVLLLSLSGAIPAAVACTFFAQVADCCPPGQPCEPQRASPAVVSNREACCDLQPMARRAVVAVNSKAERQSSDFPPPDHDAVFGHEIPIAHAFALTPRTPMGTGRFQPDQQQLYLLTGRLRR